MEKPELHKLQSKVNAEAKPSLEKRIKRGGKSWNFIYILYGLILSIITFFISILPFNCFHKLIIFVVIVLILTWLFLFNAWFQNKIIGFKIKIEETWRKI